jgi:hypothetical protein
LIRRDYIGYGWHKEQIKEALLKGKPVPEEVLRGYPDLKIKKATIAPEVLEKAREWDKKHPEGVTTMPEPDYKITDVTPAGYGPTETKEEPRKFKYVSNEETVTALYKKEIGEITDEFKDEFKKFAGEYYPHQFEAAIKKAVADGRKEWPYIKALLKKDKNFSGKGLSQHQDCENPNNWPYGEYKAVKCSDRKCIYNCAKSNCHHYLVFGDLMDHCKETTGENYKPTPIPEDKRKLSRAETEKKKKEAPMVKVAHRIIDNSPELKVKNLEELPHGTGAAYLEVIESHIPGEYIAAAWRRKVRENEPGIFIKFDRTPRGDTSGTNVKGWKVERSEYNDYQTLLNQYHFQIGEVTATIRENIKQMLEHHPVDWVSAAIQKAADDKKKSWGPIKDLISTWDENGKPNSIKPIPALEDKEPETVKAGAKVVEKGRESYTEKDDEEYYKEFAEPREGTSAPGRDEYKGVEAPAAAQADITDKKEEVAPAMKAEIKESIKEGKAIDKSAEAAVKEAEKIIEKTPEPEPAIRSHLKTMSFEDRMMYREVVERRLENVQRMAMEMAAEALTIREYMNTDPIATYRAKVGTRKLLDSAATKAEGKKVYKQTDVYYKLTDLLSKTGEWPETLSKKQANLLLMGRTLKPTSVNAKGRVPWEYVLDELASIFGVSEQELINHVENIAEQKARLRDMDTLISEAADREKELMGAMEELQKLDNITGGAPTEYAQPFIRQTPGEPEAGMQKGMFGEDKEVRPQGKGKVTQINLMEYGKLQERKATVKKPDDLHADIMDEVRKLQEQRSPRAVAGDNAQTAMHVVKGEDASKWLKHPERFDIRGVDTKRAHRAQRAPGAARVRTSR